MTELQELSNLCNIVTSLAKQTQSDSTIFYKYLKKHDERIRLIEKELNEKDEKIAKLEAEVERLTEEVNKIYRNWEN